MCMWGGCYQLPPSNPQRSGPLPGFSLHPKSREGRWGGDAQHRGGPRSDLPPLPDKREGCGGPGEQEKEK